MLNGYEIIKKLVEIEMKSALIKHGKFKNYHELYSVLGEEVDETKDELVQIMIALDQMWKDVKKDNESNINKRLEYIYYRSEDLINEAIQVMAVSKRYLYEKRGKDNEQNKKHINDNDEFVRK